MALILVSSYLCLNAAISSQKLIEPRLAVIQNARVAVSLITADLRAACPLSKECDFLGTQASLGDIPADSLTFATHNYTPHRDREGDFCEVTFSLGRDPRSGEYVLYRRRNPLIAYDAFAGAGKTEEIARGLLGLRLQYYDGFDWYDNWGELTRPDKVKSSLRVEPNLEGLPVAARITLWFDADPRPRSVGPKEGATPRSASNENLSGADNAKSESATAKEPLVFQTIVTLELAAAPQRASTGDAGTDTGGQQQPQPLPQNPNGGQP
jgi:hypothetical protein